MQLQGCGSYVITQHSCPRRPVTASLPQRQARPIYVYLRLGVGVGVGMGVCLNTDTDTDTHIHTHTHTHGHSEMQCHSVCARETEYMCLRNVPYVLAKCVLAKCSICAAKCTICAREMYHMCSRVVLYVLANCNVCAREMYYMCSRNVLYVLAKCNIYWHCMCSRNVICNECMCSRKTLCTDPRRMAAPDPGITEGAEMDVPKLVTLKLKL